MQFATIEKRLLVNALTISKATSPDTFLLAINLIQRLCEASPTITLRKYRVLQNIFDQSREYQYTAVTVTAADSHTALLVAANTNMRYPQQRTREAPFCDDDGTPLPECVCYTIGEPDTPDTLYNFGP